MSSDVAADPHLAALKQIPQLILRKTEMMTFNNLFEGIIAVIFLISFSVSPFLKKMDKEKFGMIPN